MKIILISFLLLSALWGMPQTATNFNVPDCDGTTYELFNELQSGKVVVICWVMPCASCVVPTQMTYNIVQSFQSSHPGKVQMLLCDDYANSSCSYLKSWAAANGINDVRYFSNSAIKMTDYGSNGMPKVVVVSGFNGDVLYNKNSTADTSLLRGAINNGLLMTSVNQTEIPSNTFSVYPNPAGEHFVFNMNILTSDKVEAILYNYSGNRIKSLFKDNLPAGPYSQTFSLAGYPSGLYFIEVREGSRSSYLKIIVQNP